METEDSCDALIPRLPDDLVLTHVITRLPWHARPVCRAVSKLWRARIDASTKDPQLLATSRRHLLPLIRDRFLLCTFDLNVFITEDSHGFHHGARNGYHCLQWREEIYKVCRQWRKVPSLDSFFPPPPACLQLMASCGMIYVWSNAKDEGFMLKMDMAGGDWTWNKIKVPHPCKFLAVPYNAKIYVPGVWTEGESAGTGQNVVYVHDMMDGQFELINSWNRDNLRVLPIKKSGAFLKCEEQELYSFVEHNSLSEPKLEILVYDTCKNSWSTKDMIPFPRSRRLHIEDLQLVIGDCFEPALDRGINVVWADSTFEVISWFNSSFHECWNEFHFNWFVEGMCLEYLQFTHGQLYGMFIEDHNFSEDEIEENRVLDREKQQYPSLYKRTIMKGTMVVKTDKVRWEEILDIGCFREIYKIGTAMVPPVEDYTIMA